MKKALKSIAFFGALLVLVLLAHVGVFVLEVLFPWSAP